MAETAFTREYPLTPADRAALVEKLMRYFVQTTSIRAATAIARALIAADGRNTQREAHQLTERLADRGERAKLLAELFKGGSFSDEELVKSVTLEASSAPVAIPEQKLTDSTTSGA